MRFALAGLLVLVASCGDAEPAFVLDLSVTDQAGGAYEITIDGTPLGADSDSIGFDSYDASRDRPVLIQTWRDGAVVAECRLYGGACSDTCVPDRESAAVCVDADGAIFLDSRACPCSGGSTEYFCGGDCAETGPQ